MSLPVPGRNRLPPFIARRAGGTVFLVYWISPADIVVFNYLAGLYGSFGLLRWRDRLKQRQQTVLEDRPDLAGQEAQRGHPVPVFSPPLFKGQVASFTDANPVSTIADFTATIDWGDGTPLTAGTVSQPGGVGHGVRRQRLPYLCRFGRQRRQRGTYAIQVFVVDDGGSR